MKRLEFKQNNHVLYYAGLPNFPRNFSRDSIVSAIISRDMTMLSNQLSYSAYKQGNIKNPYNGEEPGKIFHEYPGVEIRGKSTLFSACDTTALYLMGHEFYQKLTNDKNLAKEQKKEIKNAVNYIISHLDDDFLFSENPSFSGAKRFALKTTYWKDSEIIKRKNGEPSYPIVYTLAHIQNMRGLISALYILNLKKLNIIISKMRKSLQKLYDNQLGNFYIGIDKKGPISGISSDSLHALFYLNNNDLDKEQLKGILKSSKVLETHIGYRTLSPDLSANVKREYHTKTVWPFEQAIINIGAKKFKFDHVEKISSRIVKVLDTDPELFLITKNKAKKIGCDPQLWTIAAKKYFNKLSKLNPIYL